MSRKFKGFFKEFGICPLCGTAGQSETILIKWKEDPNQDALNDVQVHTDCLFKNLTYDGENNLLYANCNFNHYQKETKKNNYE